MESIASFIRFAEGKTLGIAPYIGQCVMLFREWNIRNNGSEPYSAEGACNLWTTRGGHAYIWDGYNRVTGPGRYGDFTIWSGFAGAYPNGGYGHVAMFLKDNGNGTGQFLSCNPGPVSVRTLSLSGILGHLRPKVVPPLDQAPAAGAVKLVTVKVQGAKYRAAPRLSAPVLQEFAAGAKLNLKGHVTGDDAAGDGSANAWGVGAFTGGYINLATLVEDTITGLPYLG